MYPDRYERAALGWQTDEPAPEDPHCTYETVVCQACSRIHFINRSSRKLLGEKEQ
jgi:hypothetical protein